MARRGEERERKRRNRCEHGGMDNAKDGTIRYRCEGEGKRERQEEKQEERVEEKMLKAERENVGVDGKEGGRGRGTKRRG